MISIVMPVYNEEKYIDNCIQSLLNQDYPLDDMEWIFVDGCSKDRTKEIINEYKEKYPNLIKIYDNPQKIVPFAMNIGIKNSTGKYIIRLDAHAEYDSDYFSKCVHYLDTIDADNVGGTMETKSRTKMGNIIAKMLSSKFGVGNSQFRTDGKSGYVDTVPFGAFKREVFSKYGGYDERLVRNQDNEMNYRIRKNGGKIFLARDINLAYYCRETIGGISSMARKNGQWNIITMKLCPGSMGMRHFVPFAFVLSIPFLIGLGFALWPLWIVFGLEMILYLCLDCFYSAKLCDSVSSFWTLLLLFPIFHISYGVGSIVGLFSLFSKKYQKNGYVPEKI